MDGLSICVTKCFALYMAEMAFNVHLPRANLDLRFVCSTLEPLIDFKFEVASPFLFVSTKYRQKILLKTLRFMVCCVFMIPTGKFKKCHIQSSPRTVNNEEAQSSCWQVVKVALGVCH